MSVAYSFVAGLIAGAALLLVDDVWFVWRGGRGMCCVRRVGGGRANCGNGVVVLRFN